MKSTSFDPCIMYRHEKGILDGLTVIQLDDSFGTGSSKFLAKEDSKKYEYLCKRKVFLPGNSYDFNGSSITRTKNLE